MTLQIAWLSDFCLSQPGTITCLGVSTLMAVNKFSMGYSDSDKSLGCKYYLLV
jgi:hypothetical protein